MVKRCAWGTCNSDSRYPERLTGGITFIPFPKLGRTRDKAKRWIRLCGRPFEQLNEEILGERRKAKHLFVCSKHFVNGQPDPIAALHYDDHITQPRPPPKPRSNYIEKTAVNESKVLRVSIKSNNDIEYENCEENALNNKMVQTENAVDAVRGFQPMDILAHAAENIKMKEEYAKLILENENLKRSQVKQVDKGTSIDLSTQRFSCSTLTKDSFQYYTGFSYDCFYNVYKFFVPGVDLPFEFSKNISSLVSFSLEDQLLLVLIKLRQDFDFKHISNMFRISSQDCSCLFTNWINYMFYRLGSLDIWPHRDIIIENMPEQFKTDYPNTMVIIDGTELKIQRPSSLHRQSQCYSDYKSCTTLKGLVGVDPRGSIVFVSMLFSGSISDKEITHRSGFLDTLKSLLQSGKLQEGDGVMADKGFTIEKEINNVRLCLNIPPFVPSSASQMSAPAVAETVKIAKHRVHVERAICRVKQFKLLTNKVSLSLFSCVNQIWLVCCVFTNFMPFLIEK